MYLVWPIRGDRDWLCQRIAQIDQNEHLHCQQEKGFSWVSPELMFFGLFQLFIGSVINNAIIQKSD